MERQILTCSLRVEVNFNHIHIHTNQKVWNLVNRLKMTSESDEVKANVRKRRQAKLLIYQGLARALKIIAVPLFAPIRWLDLESRLMKLDLSYVRRPDDIFVVSYPKSGTTWLQMILYQLTTDGAMTMRHIDDISPHYEDTKVNLEGLKSPRIIKTHLDYRRLPGGAGHYIYVVRDGLDVAVSYYHQLLPRWTGEFGVYFREFVRGRVPYGSWFRHVSDFVKNKRSLNMLVIRYEDLQENLEETIRKIATFCSISVDESGWLRIIENCSFSFMQQHEAKFSLTTRQPAHVMIRKGRIGGWRDCVDGGMLDQYREVFDRRIKDPMLRDYAK